MPKNKEVSEDIQNLLKQVADHFDNEDKSVRERQIRVWRQIKLYWNNISNIWYSEVAHDWRIWQNDGNNTDDESAYYDKNVNVFRAYLESIIAALSVSVPAIKCSPDDADEPLDIQTAKAGDRIAELISKHNDVTLLWLHALYIFCTEGMVACYSYPKSDEKYGTYEKKEYKEESEETYLCPECGDRIEDQLIEQARQQSLINQEQQQMFQAQEIPLGGQGQLNPEQQQQQIIPQQPADQDFTNQILDEYMPDDSDIDLQNIVLNEDEIICPACGAWLDPNLEKETVVITRLVGVTTKPKSRQCMEVYGGLYVKIPCYAMKQADIPYLRFSYETHFANVIETYPELYDNIRGQTKSAPNTGVYDVYEAWGRLSPQYYGEFPINNVTVNNYWFRPAAFNVLQEEEAEKLKRKFPNGCKYVKVNECFAEAENEALDDCWTLTHNPLSDYLQHDPLGLLLVSVQDITQEIISLVLQTIEHGIGQTFADPAVLDFNAYKQAEVRPGDIFPTKQATGKNIGEGFYEMKTATLSGEILPFGQKIQEMGQLVSGATPSLFGGQLEGSRTASEYSMSRAQALQRLQTPWKMLTAWWRQIYGKVIPSFIKNVQEDERFTKKDKMGNYFNVFIRKAELQGKLGDIELEASEQLPTMWSQQRDIIMKLLEAGNPVIMETINSPENRLQIAQALGLSQFVIPGEADREKQYEEIKILLNSEPMPNPEFNPELAAMGEPIQQEISSVEIDSLVDNHQIEAEICKIWAVSDAGRLAKLENPMGYKNVLLHMQMHMQQLMMMAPQAPVASNEEEKKPKPKQAAQRGSNVAQFST